MHFKFGDKVVIWDNVEQFTTVYRYKMSVALPLSTSAVMLLQKATEFVRYDLPLVKVYWLSLITYLFSMNWSMVFIWFVY